MAGEGNGDLPDPDLWTMKELCQPSLNGRGGPIALIAIQETNFGLKNDMRSIKVNGVTDDALRLYLFPHSLTHHATTWFDRLPRKSINTFEQMAKMFLGKYFPPSMVTKLRNEITNFRQRPDESLFEAWERYKLSIDRCLNHNMLPVTQIDTFYNGLTLRHRDTINAAAGETFMKRRPEECYDLIENITAHHNDWDTSAQRSESSSSVTSSSDTEIAALKAEMAEINKNRMRVLLVNQQVKAVTPNCETYGGPHSFNDCLATVGNTENVYAAGAYQGNSYQPQGNRNLLSYHSDNYLGPPGFNQNQNRNNPNHNFQNQNRNQGNHNPQGKTKEGTNSSRELTKANDAILKNIQTNMTSLTNSNLELKNMFGLFMKMNNASSSGLRTLPGNTITNLKEDLKGITTRSGTAYQGPTIPTTSFSLPPVVECETEATKDMVHPTKNGSIEDIQPLVVPTESLILNSEPVISPIIKPVASSVSAPKPNQRPASINPMPFSVWNKLSLLDLSPTCMTIELADHSISRPAGFVEDVFIKVGTFHFLADFAVIDFDADPRVPLILGRYFLKTEIALIDVFKEYSQEVLGFSDVTVSSNPTPYYDLIVSTTSLTLTPLKNSDFLLKEVDAFLALEDDLTSPKVDQSYELKIYEAKSDKSSIDEPPEVELKGLPPHLEYAFLEGDKKLPVIIAKDLSVEEKIALITVLNSHKRAITWKLADIKGIDPEFCTHKIIMEEDFEPAIQHQRRVNPKIHDVIKNEVLKLLDAGLIYPISDTPWPADDASSRERYPFLFSKECVESFQTLKRKLTEASILIAPDWDMPFELMCDASDFAIGAVLGQCQDKHFWPIYYASKTMTEAESSYTTKEKDMLAVVYAFKKFQSYLIMNKSIMQTEHSALKYLFPKKDSKARLLCWVLLLQEFTFKVIDTKGAENLAADHLSRLENPHQNVLDPKKINESFPLETLSIVSSRGNSSTSWKPLTFLRLATMDPPGDIMAQTTQPKRFGTPRAIISDRGTHFCNDQFAKVMLKFDVNHRLATPYHPQTSGLVEVSNYGLKCILERIVGENHASWSNKLDNALWAFRTAYKTPIGCTSYKLVYEKACHLPIELEYKAYWALKHANLDLQTAGDHRKV
nr:hypothetical protein [Tanacetum cinerariifolium]